MLVACTTLPASPRALQRAAPAPCLGTHPATHPLTHTPTRTHARTQARAHASAGRVKKVMATTDGGGGKARESVVAVYAASSACVEHKYKQDAYRLGELIAKEGWVQRNGGGCTGLMAAATEGALAAGGTVDAVVLDIFVESNLHHGFRNVSITKTMADRKNGLSQNADMFIALPGGLGTLDEISDIICARQLSFHDKPVVILNSHGFYDHLHKFLLDGIKRKFIAEAVSRAVLFANTPEEAIALIKKSTPVYIDKNALNSGEMVAASRNSL